MLILGSSHVKRLECYVREYYADNVLDLSPRHPTYFFGISGARIMNSTHLRVFEAEISARRPRFVVVQVAGNDLDNTSMSDHTSRATLIDKLVMLCVTWRSRYSIHHVVVCQLLPRSVTRHVPVEAYNLWVVDANRALTNGLSGDPAISYWRHKGLKRSKSSVLLDGVHFNSHGQYKLYRSIRGAVIRCLNL